MRQRAIVPALLALMVIAADAPAQWLNLPTPGIPRTADGKPDLNAPAPRTADGKPNLTAPAPRTADGKPDLPACLA